eukprot:s8784_g1.t1
MDNHKKGDRCWQRCVRLVAREYKTDGKREDVFSPATSPGITKLVPILALLNDWAIYSVDVKDAFLQVPQRTPCLCRVPEEAINVLRELLPSWCWKLGRVLPGQRDASSLWSDFCDGLLVQEGFERSTGNPSLYRLLQGDNRKVIAICIVHVDDLQMAGKEHTLAAILANLKKKVKLQVEGPFLTKEEYERGFSTSSVRFLKRKYVFQDHELKIFSDSKRSKKLVDIIGLQKTKSKNSPCTPSCQEKDESDELDDEHSSIYRTCVGILLYVSHDRPDIQFAVRNLSTAMSRPTTRKQKEQEHLALYLKGTSDYSIVYKKAKAGTSALQKHPKAEDEDEELGATTGPREHLLEIFSDSDWEGDKQTRKSVSCAMFFISGTYFYSYSRTQKSIALSLQEQQAKALDYTTHYFSCQENESHSKHTQTAQHAEA